LATVEILQKQAPVSEENIREGLARVQWPGRLQLIQRPGGQKLLLDGAHNAAGAEVLARAVQHHFAGIAGTLILGVLQDKDWRRICDVLAPLAGRIIAVPVASDRTADPQALAAACRAANPAAAVAVEKSAAAALQAVGDDPFVLVAGSLYLVGETLELLGQSPAPGAERALNEWTAVPIR